uniref:6-pyruvoyl-tetrahydropterin synthase-related protein n=1 Tax=uncultured Caulobacter sp. TaxID=158749 RepID=UPI0025F04695|nr:6-pyruvoyl-tetrahydropterin synthase-related protein [uncultured Caulobacter sp.]
MSKLTLRWPVVLLVLAFQSFCLLRHDLGHGAGFTHSYVFNAVWVQEFNNTLAQGRFPPRWLHGAWDGMGASSFYFYPPLAFYVAAFVRYAFGTIDHPMILAWTSYLMMLGSGAAMQAWLRSRAGDAWALVGALVYVAAPYHLVSVYVRGSIGETMAYAILPLLALCLERAARSWAWVPGAALAFAALVLSHLAIAMLICVTVLPAYVVHQLLDAPKDQRRDVLLRCAAAGLLGLAAAASYLGPALSMQKLALMRTMWTGADPYDWALITPHRWPQQPFSTSMAWLAYGVGGAALAAVVAVAGRQLSSPRREALAWGVGVLIAFTLYALPWPWRGLTGQVLAKAQFPYRLLLGMEFAAVTAIVLAAAHGGRRWLLVLLLVVAAVPTARGFSMQKEAIAFHLLQVGDKATPQTEREIACHRAPEEHLPATFGGGPRYMADPFCMSGFADLPLAAAETDGAKVTAANLFPDGSVAVAVEAARPTRVVLRRYHFPTWQITRVEPGRDPVVQAQPSPGESLLSFVAEPGVNTYRARIIRSPLETACDALTLAALALIAAWLGLSLQRRLDTLGLQAPIRAFMRIRTR